MQTSDGKCISNKVMGEAPVILTKKESYRAFLQTNYNGFNVSCCNKLFRRELFDDIQFKRGIASEDVELLYRLLDICENVVCVNYSFYHYVERKDSITAGNFHVHQVDVLKTAVEIKHFINKKYPELSDNAGAFELEWLIIGWKMILQSKRKKEYYTLRYDIKRRIVENLRGYKSKEFPGRYCCVMAMAILLHCYIPVNALFELWFRKKAVKRRRRFWQR